MKVIVCQGSQQLTAVAMDGRSSVTERLAYRPEEAAKCLGMSRDTIFRLLAAGAIRGFKVGSARLISADELQRYVREREAEAEAERPLNTRG